MSLARRRKPPGYVSIFAPGDPGAALRRPVVRQRVRANMP